MEFLPAARLLMSAPGFVSAAMDLRKKISERDNERVALDERLAAMEEDAQAAAELATQHAQAIHQLATQNEAAAELATQHAQAIHQLATQNEAAAEQLTTHDQAIEKVNGQAERLSNREAALTLELADTQRKITLLAWGIGGAGSVSVAALLFALLI